MPSGPPVAIFIGMCIRVISPTPSKKALRDAGVVLNDRLPTHTEFWRFGSFEGGSSAVFCTFGLPFLLAGSSEEASVPFVVRLSFFFCRRFSAWDSTGSSSASDSEPESDWESSESLPLLLDASLSESSDSRCLFRGCEDVVTDLSESEELLEDEEEAMTEGEAEVKHEEAPECTTFLTP